MAVVRDYVMHLSPKYYSAIGEFIFRCAQLEVQLHELLWRVTDVDNRQGRVLTVGADLSAVRAMLRTAVDNEMRGHWITKDKHTLIQRIRTLLNKSKEHVELRNRLAHGSWQSPVNGDHRDVQLLFMKQHDEKYLARVDKRLDDAYLQEQCRKLRDLNERAHQLIIEISGMRGIPPSTFHRPKYIR